MKFSLIFMIFCAFCFANNADELYKKALEFESSGDIKNAMEFYKMAYKARNFSQKQDKSISENIKHQPVKAVKKYENGGYFNIFLPEPNYLLPFTYIKNIPNDGRKKFETKFHISLQKPLTYDLLGFKEDIGVAYSQTSWWQTSVYSTPFRESNYRPEIYMSMPFENFESLKSTRVGFLHESNGQSGKRSRSWNRVYMSMDFSINNFIIVPRVWFSVGDLSDNDDIKDYIGNADVKFKYTLAKHHIHLMLRNNLHLDKTNRGAAEFSWFFPLFSDGFYGYIQYFNGYGENLMDYNKHSNKIGLGFAILK